MKVATSYFYQIRFFKPNMIPVSTAIWDPKWYYQKNGRTRTYKDSRGIYNGIRAEFLNPSGIPADAECRGTNGCRFVGSYCPFLEAYKNKLNSLDFNIVMSKLQGVADKIQNAEGFEEEPIIVLMVHEKPGVSCSERATIQEYFKSHGVECEELSYPI